MATDHHGLLPNFTLIYSGVLLSLGLRLFSDKLVVLFNSKNVIDAWQHIDLPLILSFITIIYFLDDIIENTMFISSYPYRGTMRFYIDISICSVFYLCILIALEQPKYYFVSFIIMTLFSAIWSILCKKRGTGPIRYLDFNRYAYTWGSIIAIALYGWLLYNYNGQNSDQSIIIKSTLYFLLFWITLYNIARVIVIRKQKCEGAEFLEAGLIMRLFIYAFDLTIPANWQEGDKK